MLVAFAPTLHSAASTAASSRRRFTSAASLSWAAAMSRLEAEDVLARRLPCVDFSRCEDCCCESDLDPPPAGRAMLAALSQLPSALTPRTLELSLRRANPSLLVAGVDEAGVGTIAGPLVAAAVALPRPHG